MRSADDFLHNTGSYDDETHTMYVCMYVCMCVCVCVCVCMYYVCVCGCVHVEFGDRRAPELGASPE